MRALTICLAWLVVAAPAGATPAPGGGQRVAPRPAASAPSTPAAARARGAAARTAARPAPVAHRPLTLAAQNIEGRAEAPRVLFVHTGPTIALEDAPKHPSYLRDDFTAALSSPVTVHVRNLSPLRTPTNAGGNR